MGQYKKYIQACLKVKVLDKNIELLIFLAFRSSVLPSVVLYDRPCTITYKTLSHLKYEHILVTFPYNIV